MNRALTKPAHALRALVDDDLRRLVRRPVVRYRHRGLTEDDVLFAAYPKSGSTWLRFVLAGALTGDEMNFDIIRAISPPVGEHLHGPKIIDGRGHLVKSHERPMFLPGGTRPRVIWLVRDGRDVVVSRYHHLRRHGLADDFDSYFERQLDGSIIYGSWQGHVRSWLDYIAAAPSPAATVRYEDVLENPVETLLKVNDTCGLGLQREAIEKAVEANTASQMREKEAGSSVLSRNTKADSATPFVRAARSGSWRDELSPELCARFEAVCGRELTELGYELSTARAG